MTDTDSDLVLVEVEGAVATVTLNRPEARNALNRALRKALPQVLSELDRRDDIAAVVLTGSDPAFCAGLDLKELASGRGPRLSPAPDGAGLSPAPASDGSPRRDGGDLSPAPASDPSSHGGSLSPAPASDGGPRPGPTAEGEPGVSRRGPFPEMETPVIGAINGVAITGGFELALACDFLVASERARFADTHARVGIMPGWGLTVLLPEAVGFRRAKELSTTGNFLDAGTALAWGLVNHVVPHEELLPFARQLAADIASNDPVAVRRMLATYDEGALRDGAGAWALEAQVADQWQSQGLDPAQIEARRQAVLARGRTQL